MVYNALMAPKRLKSKVNDTKMTQNRGSTGGVKSSIPCPSKFLIRHLFKKYMKKKKGSGEIYI
jgi:hypothetical protein